MVHFLDVTVDRELTEEHLSLTVPAARATGFQRDTYSCPAIPEAREVAMRRTEPPGRCRAGGRAPDQEAPEQPKRWSSPRRDGTTLPHGVASIIRDVAAIAGMFGQAGLTTLCMKAASRLLDVAERNLRGVALDLAKGCMAVARWIDPALRR